MLVFVGTPDRLVKQVNEIKKAANGRHAHMEEFRKGNELRLSSIWLMFPSISSAAFTAFFNRLILFLGSMLWAFRLRHRS